MSTIAIIFLALPLGFFLTLWVLILVTHLMEKRPVRYLVPASQDDPEYDKLRPFVPKLSPRVETEFNPYASPQAVEYAYGQNHAAAALGFTLHGLYRHVKGGTYNVHAALWTSPDRRTLAVIGWGTLVKINASKTLLYSRLESGIFLLTCDKLPGNDTPGLYEIVVVQNAPLDRLVRRHKDRIAASGSKAIPFDGPDALADYEGVLAARHEFLVEQNDEYYIDPGQTAVRSTVKGAFKALARTWKPPNYVERIEEPGAEPTPVGRPAAGTPAALTYASWFFNFLVLFGLFLSYMSPTRTLAQSLFRLGLLALGVLGTIVVGVIRFVLKRQARRN